MLYLLWADIKWSHRGCYAVVVAWQMFSFPYEKSSQALIPLGLAALIPVSFRWQRRDLRPSLSSRQHLHWLPIKLWMGLNPMSSLWILPSVRVVWSCMPAQLTAGLCDRNAGRSTKMEVQIEMEMRQRGGVHYRPADPQDVGEDVWIIPSNKSH